MKRWIARTLRLYAPAAKDARQKLEALYNLRDIFAQQEGVNKFINCNPTLNEVYDAIKEQSDKGVKN